MVLPVVGDWPSGTGVPRPQVARWQRIHVRQRRVAVLSTINLWCAPSAVPSGTANPTRGGGSQPATVLSQGQQPLPRQVGRERGGEREMRHRPRPWAPPYRQLSMNTLSSRGELLGQSSPLLGPPYCSGDSRKRGGMRGSVEGTTVSRERGAEGPV